MTAQQTDHATPSRCVHLLSVWVLVCLSTSAQAAGNNPVEAASAPLALAPVSQRAVWVNAGFYSLHFDKQAGLRDANAGLGLEVRLNHDWAATAGRFMNSDSVHSNYVGAYYRPWHFAGGQWGFMGGMINGYPKAFNGGWFPAVVPVATWESGRLGLNVSFVPPIQNRLYGAVSFQAKLRVY